VSSIPRKTVALLAASGAMLLAAAPSVAQAPGTHQHSFGDAAKWAHYFDDPERDQWQKPHEVIQALGLKPDDLVADIGAGTGYFSMRLANFVPQGRVYGVDIEPDMVKYLAERAQKAGVKNVTALAGKADGPNLPRKVDIALMVDVFHHIENRAQYFKNLKASLKPGGRLAIIDFNATSPSGPPLPERVPVAQVKDELAAAGYAVAAEHDFLPNQYYVIFTAR
jgi:ubiquinone/menaquinone biosynthesis C-methylase UbiE